MFLTGAAQNYFVLKLADDVGHLDVRHIKFHDFSVASDKFFRPQGWHPFGSSFSYLVCSSCSSSPDPSRTCHHPPSLFGVHVFKPNLANPNARPSCPSCWHHLWLWNSCHQSHEQHLTHRRPGFSIYVKCFYARLNALSVVWGCQAAARWNGSHIGWRESLSLRYAW